MHDLESLCISFFPIVKNLNILPRKNLQNGVTLKRHCKPAFTKHVLPRFCSPHTPATGSRSSAICIHGTIYFNLIWCIHHTSVLIKVVKCSIVSTFRFIGRSFCKFFLCEGNATHTKRKKWRYEVKKNRRLERNLPFDLRSTILKIGNICKSSKVRRVLINGHDFSGDPFIFGGLKQKLLHFLYLDAMQRKDSSKIFKLIFHT